MFIIIYRNNLEIATVEPLDSSELSQQKQIEDLIRLNFQSDSYIDLQIGDYIIFDKTGQKYFLNKLPTVADENRFNYECEFESVFHDLKKTKILLDKDYAFPLTGNAKTFLQFIVENLNRNGGVFIVGEYIDTSDITVSFSNWNAFEAITELSILLSFDWYLEGSVLNFTAKNQITPYIFFVGMKKGFLKLTRNPVDGAPIKTVVYGYGSTDNLPPRTGVGMTYNSLLLMENRLYFSGTDGESKIEKGVEDFGRREDVVIFDDIKPERTGIITGIDSTNVNVFTDSLIDFDINTQKMEGIKPKIKFISGTMLGLQFNISYDNPSKKITMDVFSDESGNYPNETIKPEIGATYKLFDIIMPQTYIDAAAIRLKEATQSYIDTNSKSMVIYEGEIDNEFIAANNIVLHIGDMVRVVSGSFRIDNSYEIKALTQSITNPNIYNIQFGDVLPKGLIYLLQQTNFNTQQNIYQISSSQITNNEVTNITEGDISWETW